MEKNLWKKNFILIILVVVLAVFPLIFVADGEFGGSDDQAEQLITDIDSNYKPWFESLWEPPSITSSNRCWNCLWIHWISNGKK